MTLALLNRKVRLSYGKAAQLALLKILWRFCFAFILERGWGVGRCHLRNFSSTPKTKMGMVEAFSEYLKTSCRILLWSIGFILLQKFTSLTPKPLNGTVSALRCYHLMFRTAPGPEILNPMRYEKEGWAGGERGEMGRRLPVHMPCNPCWTVLQCHSLFTPLPAFLHLPLRAWAMRADVINDFHFQCSLLTLSWRICTVSVYSCGRMWLKQARPCPSLMYRPPLSIAPLTSLSADLWWQPLMPVS